MLRLYMAYASTGMRGAMNHRGAVGTLPKMFGSADIVYMEDLYKLIRPEDPGPDLCRCGGKQPPAARVRSIRIAAALTWIPSSHPTCYSATSSVG